MPRGDMDDFIIFLAVARERSFTRAAAKLGVSQSALSHTVRQLEARLQLRLLTRTTRSVAPTQAGEHLLKTLGPLFDEVLAEIDGLAEFRDRPSGNIRITATDYAIDTILWPKLRGFLARHPEIKVELVISYGLADIVAERFDAGVRLGDQVDKDMVSVPIGPRARFAVVGSPDYFAEHPPPATPRDLIEHSCITLRLPTAGGLYAWEFERDGQELRVRVEGRAVFSSVFQALNASLDGFGLCHLPEDIAAPHVAAGKLVRVLEEWCPTWDGLHLYYPARLQTSSAFSLLVEALRHRA